MSTAYCDEVNYTKVRLTIEDLQALNDLLLQPQVKIAEGHWTTIYKIANELRRCKTSLSKGENPYEQEGNNG